jgi:hypothetical protein
MPLHHEPQESGELVGAREQVARQNLLQLPARPDTLLPVRFDRLHRF